MNSFEWFLLIVVVIVVPLTIAVVVTLWTIDQANKRKRANRRDAQIGVKRKAALSPEEVEARKAARAEKQAAAEAEANEGTVTINNLAADESSSDTGPSSSGNDVTINTIADDASKDTESPEDRQGDPESVHIPSPNTSNRQ